MNLTLMGYGADVSLDFVGRFIDDLSCDIKRLIVKMKDAPQSALALHQVY